MVRTVQVQDTFSGPLDLLLYLVRRDEIDIHDIPVGHVTKEYLVELNKMSEIDVDAGGEFLAMASMLTEIKGRMLLPDVSEEEDEDDELYDPRQGLVEALLEYKKFKEVAAELEAMSNEFDERYGRNVKVPEFQAVVKEKADELGALDLLAAFQRIARKMLNERAPREIVSEEVPTEVRIKQIEEVVSLRGRVSFTSILSDSPSEDEMVGFFIAMLELIRMRKIDAQQSVDFSEIYFIAISESENSEEKVVDEQAEDSVKEFNNEVLPTYIRSGCFGMSNAFGIRRASGVSSNFNRKIIANRYDMLSIRGSASTNTVKQEAVLSAGMEFPLLFSAYHKKSVSKVLPEKPEEYKLIENIACIAECKYPAIQENRGAQYRASFKLSNPFSSSSNIMIKQSCKCKSVNKYDVLGLKRGMVVQPLSCKNIPNPFEFLKICTGRICHNTLSHLKECDSTIIESKVDKENQQRGYTRSSSVVLANPFAMQRQTLVASSSSVSPSYTYNKFDMFSLNNRKAIQKSKQVLNNPLEFMKLAVGRLSNNRAVTKDGIGVGIAKAIVEHEVDKLSPQMTLCRNGSTTLANPFAVQRQTLEVSSGSISLSYTYNKFDMFSLNNRKATQKSKQTLNNPLEFMKLSLGKLCCNSVAKNDGVIKPAVEDKIDELTPRIGLSRKGRMVLANPFVMQFAEMSNSANNSSKISSYNSFDMLSLRSKDTVGSTAISMNNTLEFLPLGVGRVSKHITVIEDFVICNSEEVIMEKKFGSFRNEFKLCGAFGLEKTVVKTEEMTRANKFDFMAGDARIIQSSKSSKRKFVSFL